MTSTAAVSCLLLKGQHCHQHHRTSQQCSAFLVQSKPFHNHKQYRETHTTPHRADCLQDKRVDFEEWQKLKQEGWAPFGQLPVLEVDGKYLAQSAAIGECGRALSCLHHFTMHHHLAF
jgi:hypothetical protein